MMIGSATARTFGAVVAVVALLTLMTVPAGGQTSAAARVRVAHFSPDTPGVDVYLDGQRAAGNVGFRTVTNYLSVPGGEHQLALRPSGASPASPPVLTGAANLDGGKAYTVAGLGTRAQLHVGVFVDALQAPPAGKANVRFVHAVVGANAVNVAFNGNGTEFGDAKFGAATDYRPVTPGRYEVSLKDTTGATLLRATPVEFGAGLTYTLAALGGGNQPVRILPVVDQRAAAAAPAGGMATGGGGTAVRPHRSRAVVPLVLGFTAAVAVLGGGLVWRRRRRVV
jgi:hypothetical protein